MARRSKRIRAHRLLRRRIAVVSAAFATAAATFATTAALTASSTVPVSYAVQNARAIAANDLKPSDCAALSLNNIVLNNNGRNIGSDLVLGTSANDTITTGIGPGSSCIVGGAGTDTVTVSGSGGTAVCVISTTSTQTGCTTIVRRP
jgi:hypothetical protein